MDRRHRAARAVGAARCLTYEPSAALVGHSIGTLVAQRLAVDHPNLVDGPVLTGAFPTLHG